MARVALKTGAYTSRSLIAGCQRSVNLFAEKNQETSPVEFTYYPAPGLRPLSVCPVPGAGRGMFRASNGVLYAAVGQRLYSISETWVWTFIGTLAAARGTPVSMSDNSLTLLIVDGTDAGYTVDLKTGAFGTVSSAGFYGADRVDFLDTFFVLNKPGTGIFYSSLGLSTTFDPLYFATKIGYPDPLASIAVLHREIWLPGRDTTEVFVNAGLPAFPFQIMDGVFVQQGCVAKYSVTVMADALFWLSQDKHGQGVVLQGAGYKVVAISTHAIAAAIASYPVISDAVGWAYQQEQHQFYVLTFPTADKTWCYDISTGQWHERVSIDSDGAEHRHRGMASAFAYNENAVMDWETGQIYALDLDTYTDNGSPIVRRRGFPHMLSDGNRVIYKEFIADMETGNVPGLLTTGPGPQLSLRWSDTRGLSWSNPITTGMGASGEYIASLAFQRLGMARDRVFELSWSSPVRTALNGAFVDSKPLKT